MNHEWVKIDPFFLIWLYVKITTRLGIIEIDFDPSMLHTRPRQNMPLKYKLHYLLMIM